MITGLHAIVYTADADADRAFFRDVLEFPAVDAGGGWLIFGGTWLGLYQPTHPTAISSA